MQTEPEVLTDHNELILSTNIERVVTGRDTALNPTKDMYEDEYFSIRYFQKGTAHLTFKRLELIERMNDIIAKHYPGMLAKPR